eukprot:TRINITY_DN12842_c0_g1_i1.p1 TRINITY_DN12842_c0_g1~~TRINITY_DN12842_c0_g1_i1.p1  ORF type:complete len:121 (-),score=12.36 TRINITY_DN12842_c0_g1_i1:74-436(-)
MSGVKTRVKKVQISSPLRQSSAKAAPTRDAKVPVGDPAQRVEELKKRQNEELLAILAQEQAKENEREFLLAGVEGVAERRRLELIFGVERAKANQHIMNLTREHELVLAQHMVAFGIRKY